MTRCAGSSGLFAPLSARFETVVELQPDALFRGISGIDYDPQTGYFFAISDDRSRHAPARFYRFKLDDGSRVADLQSFVLRDTDGNLFARDSVDAEAIRYLGEHKIIWASEQGPQVHISDWRTGVSEAINLPDYVISSQGTGARANKAIEGIAVTRDFQFAIFALEAPLQQDGGPPTLADGSYSRLLVYDLRHGFFVAEYLYPLDAIPLKAEREPLFQDNGIAEILVLDEKTLLVLERSGRHIGDMDFAFDSRLYQVRFEGASNISGIASIHDLAKEKRVPARKKRLLALSELPTLRQGNFEGVTTGPDLHNKRTLYLVADDNFNNNHATQLLLLSLDE